MISLCGLAAILLFLWLSNHAVKLARNYAVARKMGLPIVVLPVYGESILWMTFSVPLRPWLKKKLPFSIFWRLTISIYGWEYHERRIPFKILNSDTFVLVTPEQVELWSIDPEVVSEMSRRPADFVQGETGAEMMKLFGSNLIVSTGESWLRQRKLLTGVINERISKIVFEETWKQTQAMLEDAEQEGDRQTQDEASEKVSSRQGFAYPSTFSSMKRIASNVLFRTAYGLPQEFKPSLKSHKVGKGSATKLDMVECIESIILDFAPAAFLPTRLFTNYPSFLPFADRAQRLGAAMTQFPSLVEQRLKEERKAMGSATEVRSNLTSLMIQASEMGGDEESIKATDKKNEPFMSEEELRGNMFVFTIAGFETTASVLTFALVLLMAYPEWQKWLFEEIDDLFKQDEKSLSESDEEEMIDYVSFYPKAIRCLAFMMEIMRVFPPVVHQSRSPSSETMTVINTSKGTYHIPPKCHMVNALPSLHVNPEVWRNLNLDENTGQTSEASSKVVETMEDVFNMTQDEYVFRPSRWINKELKRLPDGSMAQNIFQPPRGTYQPFSGGPRICPGQKMAQVEFVCVILCLLRDHRIEAAKLPGETDKQLRKRLQRTLNENHTEVTVVMNNLSELDVRFVKR